MNIRKESNVCLKKIKRSKLYKILDTTSLTRDIMKRKRERGVKRDDFEIHRAIFISLNFLNFSKYLFSVC
jgi:hypothetical protein